MNAKAPTPEAIKELNTALEQCDRITGFNYNKETDRFKLAGYFAADDRVPMELWNRFNDAAWIASRFSDVVEVSKRTKASVLHEALDEQLPILEQRYAKQLKKLRAARKN